MLEQIDDSNKLKIEIKDLNDRILQLEYNPEPGQHI